MQTNLTNEQIIRDLYQAAEIQDAALFTSFFTEDGYFWDVSAGKKYFGTEIGDTVNIYATAFPNMHRELYDVYVKEEENLVVVELSLNGTHKGPLVLPFGTIAATGKDIHTPCCDVFHLVDGKIKSFHCYTAATILFAQLEVLSNISASIEQPK